MERPRIFWWTRLVVGLVVRLRAALGTVLLAPFLRGAAGLGVAATASWASCRLPRAAFVAQLFFGRRRWMAAPCANPTSPTARRVCLIRQRTCAC